MENKYNEQFSKKKSFFAVRFFKARKIISVFTIIIISALGYYAYAMYDEEDQQATYKTEKAVKGSIANTVSGTGQVSMSQQVEINSKSSGEVVAVKVSEGQEVKSGTLLFQIDSSDAAKNVRDAQTDLETAKLELEELMKSADDLSLLQAKNNLEKAREDYEKLIRTQESEYNSALENETSAQKDLEDAYEDAFNDVSDVFLDLPGIMSDLYDILYSKEIAQNEDTLYSYLTNISSLVNTISQWDYEEKTKLEQFSSKAEANYKKAREAYDKNFENYKDISRYSENEDIVELLNETLDTSRLISEAIKSSSNMFDYWSDYRSQNDSEIFSSVTSYKNTLSSFTGTTNGHISSLISINNSINNNLEAIKQSKEDVEDMNKDHPVEIESSKRGLIELEQKLKDLESGPDEMDIRAKRISIQKAQDNLFSAQSDLSDYYIKAPFDGIVAEVSVSKGDDVSSGTSLGTMTTDQHIAEITLNEIDIVSVSVGQKAIITFDAVESLSITGEVASVDMIGSVTQGVVSYRVKIVFDVQDDRIKPGMSVSVSIITESKQDAIIVPLAAVKTGKDYKYVEIMNNNVLKQIEVETGVSSDTMIEIKSGIEEGDLVVTQTTSSNSSSNSSSSKSGTSNQIQNQRGGMMMMMR